MGVLFTLLITAFVTCIIKKKRRPLQRASGSTSVPSSPLSSLSPMSSLVIKKDKPPDYNSVIKLKEREDQELPTYSEAVSDNTGDINETEDVTDDTKHDKISDDKKDAHTKCDELSQV